MASKVPSLMLRKLCFGVIGGAPVVVAAFRLKSARELPRRRLDNLRNCPLRAMACFTAVGQIKPLGCKTCSATARNGPI